jgi:hypothetical protein
VEVNGKRLAPPTTFYGVFTLETPWMYLPITPDVSITMEVYVNGVLYTNDIPYATSTISTSNLPFKINISSIVVPNTLEKFVFFGNLLVALNSSFTSGNVVVVMTSSSLQPDYIVNNGVLTILTTVFTNDYITATTFSNANSMNLQTVVYNVGTFTNYFVPIPFAKDYSLVSMDGLTLSPDFDYNIYDEEVGWDSVPWDSVPYDLSFNTGILDINNSTTGNIVATITTNKAARETMEWRVCTNTPAFLRMTPIIENNLPVLGVPTHGNSISPQPLYNINYEYSRITPYMAGSLQNELQINDTSIVIDLFLEDISPKLQDANPLQQPSPLQPGVIWIGPERIEYFGLSRSNNVVTLSGIRRGTSGTTVQEQRIVVTGTGNGSVQTYYLGTTTLSLEVFISLLEVMVDGIVFTEIFPVISSNQLYVELTAPVGSFVAIAMTTGYTYPVGTKVYNGVELFNEAVPIGKDVGDRELYPMTRIIAG